MYINDSDCWWDLNAIVIISLSAYTACRVPTRKTNSQCCVRSEVAIFHFEIEPMLLTLTFQDPGRLGTCQRCWHLTHKYCYLPWNLTHWLPNQCTRMHATSYEQEKLLIFAFDLYKENRLRNYITYWRIVYPYFSAKAYKFLQCAVINIVLWRMEI